MKITMEGEYQTKDRRSVRILCTDRQGGHPVIGLMEENGSEQIRTWNKLGKDNPHGKHLDLVPVPTYRPYKPAEMAELVGGVVKMKDTIGCDWLISEVRITACGSIEVSLEHIGMFDPVVMTPDALLRDYTQLDGEPCGVKESP